MSFIHDDRNATTKGAAHIIRSVDRLPAIEQSPRALADDMLGEKDIAAMPSADEPALVLSDAERRAAVERALARSVRAADAAVVGERGTGLRVRVAVALGARARPAAPTAPAERSAQARARWSGETDLVPERRRRSLDIAEP